MALVSVRRADLLNCEMLLVGFENLLFFHAMPDKVNNILGVGIDLTIPYGTAAIHFKNGTTRDLIRINGALEYLSAMRILGEDAQRVRNGMNSSMKRILFWHAPEHIPYAKQYWWSPWAWYQFISKKLSRLVTNPPAIITEDLPDDWIYTIAGMLSDIKSAAMDSLDPPLQYNDVLLTWPDFESSTGHIYKDRFRFACHLPGLQELGRSNIVSNYALRYQGVDVDAELDSSFNGEFHSAVLVISYNAASLGITLNTKDLGGLPWPARLLENTQHGAEHLLLHNNHDSTKYWNEVKELLETVIGNQTIDYLLLLGSHARDPNLFWAIRDVIKDHHDIDLSILDRYMPSISHSKQDEDEPLFTAARRAAIDARWGMGTGFDDCVVPDYCETGEENRGKEEVLSEL